MDNNFTAASSVPAFDKAALFAALKPKTREVDIEGFGKIRMIGMSNRMAEEMQKKANDANVKPWAYMLINCAFDLNNRPIFNESDVDALQDSGNAQIEALLNEGLIVNGNKKAPDEKNLPATPSADSSSV